MGLAQRKVDHSPEAYLEFERSSETRHEYLDGHVYAMAGESLSHSRICVNIAAEMRRVLKGRNCEALSPNMKVRAETKGLFAYPDLSVVCGEPIFHDDKKDVLLNPKLIVEVLSPSTQRYDQTKKFFKYRTEIPSLSDYILIYQDVAFIEHYEKQDDGHWVHKAFEGLNSILRIPSIDCEILLAEVFDRVEGLREIPADEALISTED